MVGNLADHRQPERTRGWLARLRLAGGTSLGNGALRRLRWRREPLFLRHDMRLLGIEHLVRRHDLHAVLVEDILDVTVQAAQHLGARRRLLERCVGNKAVLDVVVR